MNKHFLQFIIIFGFINLYSVNAQSSKTFNKELFDDYISTCYDYNVKRHLDSTKLVLKKIDSLLLFTTDSTYYHKRNLIESTCDIGNGNYVGALDKLLKAKQFFKINNDTTYYYNTIQELAVCNYYLNRKETAVDLFQEVVDNRNFVTEYTAIKALANVGAIGIELGASKNDTTYFYKSIKNLSIAAEINKSKKRYGFLSSNYSLLSEAFTQLNNGQKALEYIDLAISYGKLGDNKSQERFALIKKTNLLIKENKLKEALKVINKTITFFDKGQDIPTLLYAKGMKKHVLTKMKMYKQALVQADSIDVLRTDLFNKQLADGVNDMEVKYKTAEKEKQILIQRAELAEQSLTIQKRNYQLFGLIGLALIFGLIGYLFYNQQKLKNSQLQKENELKDALVKIETQNRLQEQRLRISRDLHDNIGAQLTFIISSIDNLKYGFDIKDEKLTNRLDSISNFTSSTIYELRDTIWAMNKNEITFEDLNTRITNYIDQAKIASNNIEFQFNSSNDIDYNKAFSSVEGINIHRVIQESINNSLKHANASLIKVDIKKIGSAIEINISDNGNGFDITSIKRGNGLTNMKKRIEDIGGDFKIVSNSNQGTQIIITI